MNGSKPLTAVQRETLTFLRAKAAEWIGTHGGARLNIADPVQVGKALGAAEAVMETLLQTVPEER